MQSRRRVFDGIVVAVDLKSGAPHGSRIRHGGLEWHLDAWPGRVREVHALDGGALVVTMADGAVRLLEAQDAAA